MAESEIDSSLTFSLVGNVLCVQGTIKISKPGKWEAAEGTLWKS